MPPSHVTCVVRSRLSHPHVHTPRVSLKYYTMGGAQQIHFWGAADRAAYLDAMRLLLRRYLKQGDSHP